MQPQIALSRNALYFHALVAFVLRIALVSLLLTLEATAVTHSFSTLLVPSNQWWALTTYTQSQFYIPRLVSHYVPLSHVIVSLIDIGCAVLLFDCSSRRHPLVLFAHLYSPLQILTCATSSIPSLLFQWITIVSLYASYHGFALLSWCVMSSAVAILFPDHLGILPAWFIMLVRSFRTHTATTTTSSSSSSKWLQTVGVLLITVPLFLVLGASSIPPALDLHVTLSPWYYLAAQSPLEYLGLIRMAAWCLPLLIASAYVYRFRSDPLFCLAISLAVECVVRPTTTVGDLSFTATMLAFFVHMLRPYVRFPYGMSIYALILLTLFVSFYGLYVLDAINANYMFYASCAYMFWASLCTTEFAAARLAVMHGKSKDANATVKMKNA
jgi:hypothetical protein